MRTITVDGLSDDQVQRVQRYVTLLKRVGPREVAANRLLELLKNQRQQPSSVTEEEAMELSREAVDWARNRQ